MDPDQTKIPPGDVDKSALTYARYLQLSALLELQSPITTAPDDDELAFIIVHQAYELWFKLLLSDLRVARDSMTADYVEGARASFARVHAVCRVMIEQLAVLESLPLPAFDCLRDQLGTASGFESAQFRELEALGAPAQPLVSDSHASEPSLWDAYCALLERGGLVMPSDDIDARTESLLMLVRDEITYGALVSLMRAMVDFDGLFSLWRARHVLLVQRCIGRKRGTAGTSGAPYLIRTLEKRFFPELWELPTFV